MKCLQANNSVVAMQNTMFAFKAAVQEASSDDTTTCRYKVEGSAGQCTMYHTKIY